MRPGLLDDLAAEGAALDDVLTGLGAADWALPTPATGWTVAHQVAHLAWTDEVSLLAVTDPPAFEARRAEPDADRGAALQPGEAPAALLARWRDGRARLADALADVPDGTRIAWYGPPMSAASMATARLMETWAHGVDVGDALGRPPVHSARLDHVAHLGVRTRAFAFTAHGRPPPQVPVRVELTRPDGSTWTDGPEVDDQVVRGPLLDFCLRVVQRRPRSALRLVAVGRVADEWLDVAQAFAGEPGSGSGARRPPGRPRGPGAGGG